MKAYYLDDGIILEGQLNVDNMIFVPDSFNCGFSSQKIFNEDISVTLFLRKRNAEYAKAKYDFSAALNCLKVEILNLKVVKLIYKFLDWLNCKL